MMKKMSNGNLGGLENMFGNGISSNASTMYILALAAVSVIVMIVLYNKTYKRK